MQNQFDSIDLSDNAVLILEGFPKLHRLKSLYLNNNRIIRIGRNLEGGRLFLNIESLEKLPLGLHSQISLVDAFVIHCRVDTWTDNAHPHKQSH